MLTWATALLAAAAVIADSREEISFELQNDLIWVQVATPSQPETLTFLVDTGASVSVLDRELCRKLGLSGRSRVAVEGVGGVTEGLWPIKFTGSMAGIKLRPKYLGLDLTALSAASGRKVDGIIGIDFLSAYVIRIDYKNRKLSLMDRKEFCPNPASERVELKRRNGMFLVPVEINGGAREWLRLDTGCSSSMHWVSGKILTGPNQTSHTIAGIRDTTLKATEVRAKIGQRMAKLEAIIHEKPLFAGEAGLLGNGYLSEFIVTLDARNAHLYLENHS